MEELKDNELEEINGGKKGGVPSGNGSGNRQSPYFTYIVKGGDTLSGIAHKFHTTVSELQRLNNIPNADVIKLGSKLMIPRYAD